MSGLQDLVSDSRIQVSEVRSRDSEGQIQRLRGSDPETQSQSQSLGQGLGLVSVDWIDRRVMARVDLDGYARVDQDPCTTTLGTPTTLGTHLGATVYRAGAWTRKCRGAHKRVLKSLERSLNESTGFDRSES